MLDLSAINGLTQDSRHVKPGYCFAAIKGEGADGHDYIEQAIASGATVILAERAVPVPLSVSLIISANVRHDLAKIAAEFYGPFPEHIVAVTGTNGKSSSVHFAQQIWEALGHKAAMIGTLSGGLTSPDPVTLSQKLAELYARGVTHVALEASSHGLQQHRLDGLDIAAAGFTNLSHDHLDYHQTMDQYLIAKRRLFSEGMRRGGVAVINADVAEYEQLKAAARGDVISYGKNGEQIKLLRSQPHATGTSAELRIFGEDYHLDIPLVGEFQLYNALCALGLSFLSAHPGQEQIARSVKALSNLKPAQGRMQPVAGHPQGAEIYIDYAHTPDGLQSVLRALRPHTKGQLFCVFGCGGDRDKTKRPVMGRIAFDLADVIIITDDNPRNEKTVDIRNEILAGIPQMNHNENVFEIGDRAAAISHSIKKLKKGDVLVIAGKGHESGQIIGNDIIPFDDYEQACKAIEELKK